MCTLLAARHCRGALSQTGALLRTSVELKESQEHQLRSQGFLRGVASLCRFGPYFVSPVIAGLDDKTNEPFICGMDTIGAIETAKDFMVAGTAPDSLYGMCESMWQPDMVRSGCRPK